MSKELIEKLHQRSIFAANIADGDAMEAAADRIAELEAEVAVLRYAAQKEAASPKDLEGAENAELKQLRYQSLYLVKLYDAVKNLIKVKGRHHTETAYQRLLAVFDEIHEEPTSSAVETSRSS